MKILIMLILATSTLKAENSFFKKKDLALALGVEGKSLVYKRGITTYEGYQVFPIYSIQLFNPSLLLVGKSLYYKRKLTERFSLRSRLRFDATGDDPLYVTEEKEEDRVRREKTNELDLFFQYDFATSTYLRLQLSQDLAAHEGRYFEFKGRYNLKRNKEASLFEPGLFASIGFGDSKHNEYLYGHGADESSFNNLEYGLSITSSKAIENFWPTLRLTHFEILGSKNKRGSFVKEKKGLSIEFLFAFRAW